MPDYSTRETAKKLGLHFTTLHRYIRAKKVPLPPLSRVGGVRVRLWSDADVERVRALLPRIANGRKTRHEKKQSVHCKPGSSTVSPRRAGIFDNQQLAKAKSKTKKKRQPRVATATSTSALQKKKSKP